jgi:hypothetical protein
VPTNVPLPVAVSTFAVVKAETVMVSADRPRQAEVDLRAGRRQHVARLVAVNDAEAMRRDQPLADLDRGLGDLGSFSAPRCRQTASVSPSMLENEVVEAILVADIVGAQIRG